MLMLTLTAVTRWSRCGCTHGFVLLRQKNALPSGIGRTFSLGGARSAIFSWTPPSEEQQEEEEEKEMSGRGRDQRSGGEMEKKMRQEDKKET